MLAKYILRFSMLPQQFSRLVTFCSKFAYEWLVSSSDIHPSYSLKKFKLFLPELKAFLWLFE